MSRATPSIVPAPRCGVAPSRSRLAAAALMLAVASGAFLAERSAARDIVVTDSVDDVTLNGNCTLREALIAANYDLAYDACPSGEPEPATDTLVLGPGTYTTRLGGLDEDDGFSGDLDVRFALAIRGSGAAQTTLDGAGLDRLIHVRMDAPASVLRLEGLTLRGGATAEGGGGVLLERGALVASGVVFSQCFAGAGGAILTRPGTSIALSDTTLTTNSAASGGALSAFETSVLIERSSITDNQAEERGAGLWVGSGSLELRAVTIERNVLGTPDTARGAGLETSDRRDLVSPSAVVIRDSTFRSNHPTAIALGALSRATLVGVVVSDSNGRGIDSWGDAVLWRSRLERNGGGGIVNHGRLQLIESAVRGNTATRGAGIENQARLTVLRSEVSDNDALGSAASHPAGGIYNGDDYSVGLAGLRVVDSTLSGNSAAAGGGLTATNGSWTSVRGATFSNDSAGDASGIAVHGASTQVEIQNSIVDDGCVAAQGAATISRGGNIESDDDTCGLDDPTDRTGVSSTSLALEPLADDGGPTRTHRLAPGSIAIDTAIDGACSRTDQRGDARAAAACDVGAYEAGAAPCTGPDSDDDGVPDACDACASAQDPLQGDFDADGIGDACDPCNDFDGDGYGSPASFACPGGPIEDCNDGDPRSRPGGVEIPGNGIDDDCNSLTPLPGCDPTPLDAQASSPGTRALALLDPSTLVALGWLTRRSRGIRRTGRLLRGSMLVLGLAAIGFPCHAATIEVTSTADDLALGPNGTCTLREAILAANTDAAVDACPAGSGPDTVVLPTGEFVLAIPGTHEDGNLTGDLDIWSDLVLEGAGDSASIIDAASLDTVVHVQDGTVRLVDVKLQRGVGEWAGGIRFDHGSLTLERTTVAGNEGRPPASDPATGAAGGIRSRGALEILESTIYGNHWDGSFLGPVTGGVDARAGTVHVRRSAFDSNFFVGLRLENVPATIEESIFRANGAEAIRAVGSPVTIVDSFVEDHHNPSESDEVVFFDGATLHATGVAFRRNIGSVIRLVVSSGASPTAAVIEDCTFEDNRGSPSPAISSFAEVAQVRGSTFARNSSEFGHGAITQDGTGTMTIENSTFSQNNGGGASTLGVLGSSTVRLLHTTVVTTISPSTESLAVVASAARLEVGNSLVVAECGAATSPPAGVRVSLGGNVESPGDSCGFDSPTDRVNVWNPRIGPLFAWGGSTETYVLLPGSAALQAGRDELCLPTDQRGTPRPQANHCDSGAYERSCDGEDTDLDGLASACDDCPDIPNPDQSDVDFDGLGDACDPCADADLDGYGVSGSSGCAGGAALDCDDADPSVNPGAVERPGNGLDDDCDPLTPVPNACSPEPQAARATVAGEEAGGASGIGDPLFLGLVGATLLLRARRTRRSG